MKTTKITLMAALFIASLTAAQAQFFTNGDLVVLQEGNGSAALTSAGTPIFLDQYSTGGIFLDSLAIPSTGSTALVNSGTAASEGALTVSANDQYLVIAGYNVAAGTTGVASSTSAADPRGVATVDASGNYALATTTSSFFSGNNIRSGTTDGNGNFWAAGGTSGQMYLGIGTAGNISTNVPNSRVIQDISGNLYYSTGSGSRGIYEISGTPTSGSTIANLLIPSGTLSTNASPYDFTFNPGMTTAYVADSTEYTNSTTFGGVEKWSLVGGVWTFDYSLSLGTNGADGLAVDFSGANPIIYATSANGTNLFDIVDTGSTASGTLLATAGANEAFRGLALAPTPEPSTLALAGCGLAALAGFRRFKNRRS
jgi:PEP-CTERM motif